MAHETDLMEGALFKKKFYEVFHYFQSRCQHHIHPLVTDSKAGKEKRTIPNACRAKKQTY